MRGDNDRPECCPGDGHCQRPYAPRLVRRDGQWWVATRYHYRANGALVIDEKHLLPLDQQGELKQMRDSLVAAVA